MSRSPLHRDSGGVGPSNDTDDYQCQDLSLSGGHHHHHHHQSQQQQQQQQQQPVQQPAMFLGTPQPNQQVANILALSKLIQTYRQRLQQQQQGGDVVVGDDQIAANNAQLAAQNPQMMNLLLNMYNNQQQQQRLLSLATAPGVDPQQFARLQQQIQQQAAAAFQPQQLLGQFVRFGQPGALLLGQQNQNGVTGLPPRGNFPVVPNIGADNFRASLMMASPPPNAGSPMSPPKINNGRSHRGRGGGNYHHQNQQHQQPHQNHRQHEENSHIVDPCEENTVDELHNQDDSLGEPQRKRQGGLKHLTIKTHHPRMNASNQQTDAASKHLNLNTAGSAGANSGGRMLFTLLDLDLVLYGIIKPQPQESNNNNNNNNNNNSNNNNSNSNSNGNVLSPSSSANQALPTSAGSNNTAGHAISCLSLGHLTYGIDKILSSNGAEAMPGASSGGHAASNSRSRANCPSTPDIMLLDLPEGFTINQSTLGGCVHYGVFSQRELVPRGTRFGPFQGRQVNPSEIKTNDDNTFMWEIFKDNKLSHFIDGRGSNGNWLAYVNSARFPAEQNLVAHQENGQIFYDACRDITAGCELLVWYGNGYAQSMGIPVGLKDEAAAMEVSADNEADNGSDNPEGFACERCGKVFAYKYYRDKHLKYTRCVDLGDRKFPCHLCNRSFEKRDRLRIHVLHVHEKHRPHKCSVCGKSFSQSSSLNKHMRVHSGERPYKCVYCSKAFTASSILRTHIRQHSGEKPFKCRHCGKSFASHAAHDSHVRRTHLRPANDNGMLIIGAETPTSVLQSPISSPVPSPQPSASLVIFPG